MKLDYLTDIVLKPYVGRKCKWCRMKYDSLSLLKKRKPVRINQKSYVCLNCWRDRKSRNKLTVTEPLSKQLIDYFKNKYL